MLFLNYGNRVILQSYLWFWNGRSSHAISSKISGERHTLAPAWKFLCIESHTKNENIAKDFKRIKKNERGKFSTWKSLQIISSTCKVPRAWKLTSDIPEIPARTRQVSNPIFQILGIPEPTRNRLFLYPTHQ